MSSTFPEKLFFDREKYRTPRINEVILRALNADKGFRKSKSGLTPKNLVLSALVVPKGLQLIQSTPFRKYVQIGYSIHNINNNNTN